MLFSILRKYSLRDCISRIFSLMIPLILSISLVKFIYFCLWNFSYSSMFLKVSRDFYRFSFFFWRFSLSKFRLLTAELSLSNSWMNLAFSCSWLANSLYKSPIFLVLSSKYLTLFFKSSLVRTWLFSSFSKFFFSFSMII